MNKKRMIYTSAVVIGLGGIGLGGFQIYENSFAAIPNAGKSVRLNDKQMKKMKSTYGTASNLHKYINHEWNGRNNDLIIKINENNLTRDEKDKIFASMSTMNPYLKTDNPYNGQYIASQLLLGGSLNKINKNDIESANKSLSEKPVLLKIKKQNSKELDILKPNYVMPPEWTSDSDYNDIMNMTLMTEQTKLYYNDYLKEALNRVNKDTYVGIRSLAIYKNMTDALPVGYQLQASIIKNPKGGLGAKKTDVSGFHYNLYIRNAQEGYKINYSTGKVQYQ